jgi:hypothetical protein
MPVVDDKVSSSFPEALAPLFQAAWQELSRMYAKWHVSKQLFAVSEVRVAVLNRAGRDFFALCQDSFVSDVLVSAGRLLDPATQGQGKKEKENLSLERLRNAIAALGDQDLASSLTTMLKEVGLREVAVREHRNRRLAHNDLPTILADGGSLLPSVTVADLDELLVGLAEILNVVDRHYRGNTTFFDDTIQQGDGTAVVRCLRDGLAYREEAMNRRFAEGGLAPVPTTLPPEV